MEPLPRVIAIVGPTAVGKTTLSLDLAAALDAEIVNADSRQVYQSMDIGTGKPTPQERGRAPHHLFDLVSPKEPFSLDMYLDLARNSIEEIARKGKPALIVGGTGQYVWALLEGWRPPAVAPDEAFRDTMAKRAEVVGAPALYAELVSADPLAARSIHPNNLRRIIRALEVIHATGRRFSDARSAHPPPWNVSVIGLTLERALLNARVADRVRRQVRDGWPEEVAALLADGCAASLPSFSSLGYREMAAHVQGGPGLEETVAAIIRRTRRYAHHQYAWFKPDDPRICWIDAAQAPLERALRHIRPADER